MADETTTNGDGTNTGKFLDAVTAVADAWGKTASALDKTPTITTAPPVPTTTTVGFGIAEKIGLPPSIMLGTTAIPTDYPLIALVAWGLYKWSQK